jgi:proteic killer suppression protein
MIKSFKGKTSRDLFHGNNSKDSRKLPSFLRELAVEKLDMINSAIRLSDLRRPPGNRLEALKGDLKGKHSIRINDQWRIIFCWVGEYAEEVEIIDYH